MSCPECQLADHAGMSGNPDRCTCDEPRTCDFRMTLDDVRRAFEDQMVGLRLHAYGPMQDRSGDDAAV